MYRSIWHWLCIWYKCFCLNTWENTHSEVICFQPSLWSAEIFLVAQICWMNEIVPFEMLQVQQWRLRGFPFCMLQQNKTHPFPSPFLGFRPIVTIKWQFVKGNTFFQISLVAVAGSYTSLWYFYSQEPSCHSTFYVIANTSPNPPLTQTWTKMGVVLAQFFKLLKILNSCTCRFERIQKVFHHFITESLKNYSAKKTNWGYM